ncbi:fumarate hydratase C-terminal domain-containing protein [Oscillospiraceae bacterium CM]|nr:fumarate hydratase C-terminal domain-containing protein [Oscillospiraceae bacterium CM]
MKTVTLSVSDLRAAAPNLHAGDRVFLTGTVYTARDAAHKRLIALLDDGAALPFALKDAAIYYAGPTPGHGDVKIGACGPTTSSRMDGFAPRLYDLGLVATIGKGERSAAVADAIVRNGAVYLCAVGGAGALISCHITDAHEVAFPELGCESVKRLSVENLPLIVALDCHGGDIFKEGRTMFRIG